MRAVALTLCFAVLTACFPQNPRARTAAKITEGGLVLAGVGMLAFVNSSADCMGRVSGLNDQTCQTKANVLGDIGLGLILAGLIGFIATVSTTPEEKTPYQEIKQKPEAPKVEPAAQPAAAPAPVPAAPAAPAAAHDAPANPS